MPRDFPALMSIGSLPALRYVRAISGLQVQVLCNCNCDEALPRHLTAAVSSLFPSESICFSYQIRRSSSRHMYAEQRKAGNVDSPCGQMYATRDFTHPSQGSMPCESRFNVLAEKCCVIDRVQACKTGHLPWCSIRGPGKACGTVSY